MNKIVFMLLILFIVIFILGFKAYAVPAPKVTICHATESEENPYTRIVVSENAISGHFENKGTPKAGHEDDLIFDGEVDCPSNEPTPTITVTPTNTQEEPTPTNTQGVTPRTEPTATSTPSATNVPTPTNKPEEKQTDNVYKNEQGQPVNIGYPSQSGK